MTPLFHFLIIGLLIFIALDLFQKNTNLSVIVVSQQQLRQWYGLLQRINNPQQLQQAWQQLSESEKDWFINNQIEREVLYREAKRLRLDTDDNIVRSHLINKVRFLLGDLAAASTRPDDEQLTQYFQRNKDDYRIQPQISFSHIFVRVNNNDWEQSDKQATELITKAVEQQWQANDVLGKGDNFPYHRHYVNKTEQFLNGHFGRVFASQLFTMNTELNKWAGPIRSAYGSHILYITGRKNSEIPDLATIRNRVLSDYKRFTSELRTQQEIDKLIENYRIEID